jgi:hypothetical protein
MRYAQGGGLAAEGRRRREQVRPEAARRFEQHSPAAVIAADLRVSERSLRRWRRGITPLVRVRGGGAGRVSVAGLACYWVGDLSRLIYRLHCYGGRKAETKACTWVKYRDLLIALTGSCSTGTSCWCGTTCPCT